MRQTTPSTNKQAKITERKAVHVNGRFPMGKVLLGFVIALMLTSALLLATNNNRILDVLLSKDVQEAGPKPLVPTPPAIAYLKAQGESATESSYDSNARLGEGSISHTDRAALKVRLGARIRSMTGTEFLNLLGGYSGPRRENTLPGLHPLHARYTSFQAIDQIDFDLADAPLSGNHAAVIQVPTGCSISERVVPPVFEISPAGTVSARFGGPVAVPIELSQSISEIPPEQIDSAIVVPDLTGSGIIGAVPVTQDTTDLSFLGDGMAIAQLSVPLAPVNPSFSPVVTLSGKR